MTNIAKMATAIIMFDTVIRFHGMQRRTLPWTAWSWACQLIGGQNSTEAELQGIVSEVDEDANFIVPTITRKLI